MSGWENVGVPDEAFHLPGAAGLEPCGLGRVPGEDGLLLDLGDETFGLPTSPGSSPAAPVEESVTLTDDTGMTICSDTDGDGRVDALSVVRFDGGWSSWRRVDAMVGDGVVSEEDVSSITGKDGDTGEGVAFGGGGWSSQYGGEQGRPDDVPDAVPPSTPGNGRGPWDARGWECVDRGNWG